MNDLDIIKQIEKELKVDLEKLDKIKWNSRGYILNQDGQVKDLGLYDCNIYKLKRIESFLKELKGLANLALVGNKLRDVSYLKELKGLTNLDLSTNFQIKDFSFLKELKGLINIALSFNNLRDVSYLKELKGLKILCLSYTNLKNVSFLKELKGLTNLDLKFNLQIKDFSYLKELKGLTNLDLGGNCLKDVSYLKELKGLTNLDLSYNYLRDVSYLKELKGLTNLDLRNNNLSDVSFLKKLNSLSYVNLEGNPLEIPPKEIAEQGIEAIRVYFRELDKSKEAKLEDYINNEVKLILTGNSESGKTTLVEYLKTERIKKDIKTTHWMEVSNWEPGIKLEKLKSDINPEGKFIVRIFDFGGQEYYHDTHHLFFTNNTAYLLVWDKYSNILGVRDTNIITNINEKKKVKLQHYPLEYWLEAIKHYTKAIDTQRTNSDRKIELDKEKEYPFKYTYPVIEWDEVFPIKQSKIESPVLVVQNKIDKDEVDFQNQRELKDSHSFIYDFISISLYEKKRLDYLQSLIEEIFSSMEILGSPLPRHWGVVKDSLDNYNGKPIMTIEEFTGYCNELLVEKFNKEKVSHIAFNEKSTKYLCGYLKPIGRILYYPDVESIINNIYVDRNWVIGNIYNILFDLAEKGAEFNHEYIVEKINKKDFDKDCEDLIKLMQHFRIIFNHPHKKDTYIAPLYLPIDPGRGVQIFIETFNKPIYRFQYEGFIHKGVILHFFQEFGKDALYKKDLYYYWRYGIVIKGKEKKENDLVFVKFVMGKKEGNVPAHIDLFHLKNNKDSFLFKRIIDKLKEINKGWNVKQMVTSNGKDFVPLKEIQENEERELWVFTYENKMFELNDFSEYLNKTNSMKKIFISYSKTDAEYLRQLENHLSVLKRQRYIATWHDRKLIPGEEWDGKIRKELEEADIILFLVSSDFLATDYIWDIEMKRAVELYEKEKAIVVPIVVRDCDWEESPLGKFTSPEKALVISKSKDIDEAWKKIVKELKRIIKM